MFRADASDELSRLIPRPGGRRHPARPEVEELTMIAAPFEAAPRPATARPETLPRSWDAGITRPPGTEAMRLSSPSCALDLSRSRTHDAVLDILKAYKLSGNFHANLEAVLKDLGIVDKVTFQIEPNPALAYPDCRHVVFRLNENVPHDKFDDIVRSIEPPGSGLTHPGGAGCFAWCNVGSVEP
jgi:hypothetical protein